MSPGRLHAAFVLRGYGPLTDMEDYRSTLRLLNLPAALTTHGERRR